MKKKKDKIKYKADPAFPLLASFDKYIAPRTNQIDMNSKFSINPHVKTKYNPIINNTILSQKIPRKSSIQPIV